jgi:4-hydroxy-tetrahydrodipicolinate synthase
MLLDPSRLYGIVPPLVTPFLADGYTVSEKGVHDLIDFVLAQGVHGVFVAGTTGEVAALDDVQWRRLVQFSVEACGGRVPVLAGAIAPATSQAAARARWAADLGADAVVATVPYYYPPSPREILAHYRAVVSATSLPVVLYNIPQLTKVGIDLDLYQQLPQIPRVIGLKDSSGDITQFRRAVLSLRTHGNDFRMLLGSDHLTDVAVLIGAQGTVPSLANVAGHYLVAAYEAATAGDWASSARHQEEALAITRIYEVSPDARQTGIIVGLKCALNLLGIEVGPPAAPMHALDADQTRQVETILREAHLLK